VFLTQQPQHKKAGIQPAALLIQGKTTVHIVGILVIADPMVLELHAPAYCDHAINLHNKQHNHQYNHHLPIHKYLYHHNLPHFMFLLPQQARLLSGSCLLSCLSQQLEDAKEAMRVQ